MSTKRHPLAPAIAEALGVDPDAAEEYVGPVLEALNYLPTVAAVERDLEAIRRRDEALAESALAATALAMARELDLPWNSATSKSMCAKALADVMERLRELCPPEQAKDGVDDLTKRRSERLGRLAGGAAT